MGDIGDFEKAAFALPEPDGEILRLMTDFTEYCDTLVTEEDNAANVYENWIARKSDTLSGLTPFEFIKNYACDGTSGAPVFEKYEKLVLCMLSRGVYSLPDEVLDDFFAACENPDDWREDITRKCLANLGGEDRDLAESCFMLLYKLSELPGGFGDNLYDDFIDTANALMNKNEDYASDLLTTAVAFCENGFEKTVETLAEKVAAKAGLGPVETKLLAVLCINGKRDERLYTMLRSLVKTTDMFDSELEFYFELVKDYGDPRAVTFLRTKVNQMREAYMTLNADDKAAKVLFENAYRGDSVIKYLGGAGLF